MRKGQEVTFIDADNKRRTATVEEITGAGSSYNKRLTLSYRADGETHVVEDVAHEVDAEQGQAFWMAKGERRTRTPDDEATPAAEVAAEKPDLVAFPDTPATAPPSAPADTAPAPAARAPRAR